MELNLGIQDYLIPPYFYGSFLKSSKPILGNYRKKIIKYLHYSFILFSFVPINSICKDCLNYKEESRERAHGNSDNLQGYLQGAKTRPENQEL